MLRFNVRVYGIYVNAADQVLVSDELIKKAPCTKFPGGGLEFGEGTRDCLKREFMEELGISVEVGAHFYTTDFFQLSAFNADHQVISIYYHVRPLEPLTVRLNSEPFTLDGVDLSQARQASEMESFRMIHLADLTEESVSLPIDKVVASMLHKMYLDRG